VRRRTKALEEEREVVLGPRTGGGKAMKKIKKKKITMG